MLIKIIQTIGTGIVCLFAIGLAGEAGIKIVIGLFLVTFWGLVLIGLWALYEKLWKS